jgi:hypothetical protein
MIPDENNHYLWKLLDELRMNTQQFALSIGLNRPDRVYHVLRGRNNVSKDLANLITEKYPDVNYKWLTTGEGSMLKKDISALYEEHFKSTKNGVPFYGELPVSCGQMQLAAVLSNEKPTGYVDIPGLSAIAFFLQLDLVSNR